MPLSTNYKLFKYERKDYDRFKSSISTKSFNRRRSLLFQRKLNMTNTITYPITNQMTSFAFLVQNEFKKLMTRSLFVALTVMAVVLLSPAGDNIKDIWNSPQRLTTIEADIVEINEMLSLVALDENRVIKFTSSE